MGPLNKSSNTKTQEPGTGVLGGGGGQEHVGAAAALQKRRLAMSMAGFDMAYEDEEGGREEVDLFSFFVASSATPLSLIRLISL